MITSLKLDQFRGFTKLKISPVKRINLIAGANNTGKTAILEGLFLLFMQREQATGDLAQLPAKFRSSVFGQVVQLGQIPADDFLAFWQALFYDNLIDELAGISATFSERDDLAGCFLRSEGSDKVIQIRYLPPGIQSLPPNLSQWLTNHQPSFLVSKNQHPVPGAAKNQFATKCIIISTRLDQSAQLAEMFNEVSLSGSGEETLTALLRKIDPRLQKLRYLKAPGANQPLVYAHFDGLRSAQSITQTGQGFSKLFSLFCQMLASRAKVLLIDEIENGLYYDSLQTIWKGIAGLAASEEIQVFATTHSRECIIAAHEAMKASPKYDFAMHRLQRVKGQIEVVTHDRDMLDVAIKSGMEVR